MGPVAALQGGAHSVARCGTPGGLEAFLRLRLARRDIISPRNESIT